MTVPVVTISRGRIGEHHDLDELLEDIEHEYFGPLDVSIGWARRRAPRGSALILGRYYFDTRVIRINPAIDAPWVPGYFVASIVYHECLHHLLGHGRHDGEFAEAEARFAHARRAWRWEAANLHRIEDAIRRSR